MKDYNKFQWSKFVGRNRNEQIVVRADTWEEITEGINAVKEYVDLIEAVSEAPDPTDSWPQQESLAPDVSKKCQMCGKPMEFRTGTSKTNKPWKGWFCTSGEKHPVEWIR